MKDFILQLDWPESMIAIAFIVSVAYVIDSFLSNRFWRNFNERNRISK
jgi:hypothetical protein